MFEFGTIGTGQVSEHGRRARGLSVRHRNGSCSGTDDADVAVHVSDPSVVVLTTPSYFPHQVILTGQVLAAAP